MQLSTYAVEITTAAGKNIIVYPKARGEAAARQRVEHQLAQRAMKAEINSVRKI